MAMCIGPHPAAWRRSTSDVVAQAVQSVGVRGGGWRPSPRLHDGFAATRNPALFCAARTHVLARSRSHVTTEQSGAFERGSLCAVGAVGASLSPPLVASTPPLCCAPLTPFPSGPR